MLAQAGVSMRTKLNGNPKLVSNAVRRLFLYNYTGKRQIERLVSKRAYAGGPSLIGWRDPYTQV